MTMKNKNNHKINIFLIFSLILISIPSTISITIIENNTFLTFSNNYDGKFKVTLPEKTNKPFIFLHIKYASAEFSYTIKESSETPRINTLNKVIVELPSDIIGEFNFEFLIKSDVQVTYFVDLVVYTDISILKNVFEIGKINEIDLKEGSIGIGTLSYVFIKKDTITEEKAIQFKSNDNFKKLSVLSQKGKPLFESDFKNFVELKFLLGYLEIDATYIPFVFEKESLSGSLKYLISPYSNSLEDKDYENDSLLLSFNCLSLKTADSFRIKLIFNKIHDALVFYLPSLVKEGKFSLNSIENYDFSSITNINQLTKRQGIIVKEEKFLYLIFENVDLTEKVTFDLKLNKAFPFSNNSNQNGVSIIEGKKKVLEFYIDLTENDSNSILYLTQENSKKLVSHSITSDFNILNGDQSEINLGVVDSKKTVFFTIEVSNTSSETNTSIIYIFMRSPSNPILKIDEIVLFSYKTTSEKFIFLPIGESQQNKKVKIQVRPSTDSIIDLYINGIIFESKEVLSSEGISLSYVQSSIPKYISIKGKDKVIDKDDYKIYIKSDVSYTEGLSSFKYKTLYSKDTFNMKFTHISSSSDIAFIVNSNRADKIYYIHTKDSADLEKNFPITESNGKVLSNDVLLVDDENTATLITVNLASFPEKDDEYTIEYKLVSYKNQFKSLVVKAKSTLTKSIMYNIEDTDSISYIYSLGKTNDIDITIKPSEETKDFLEVKNQIVEVKFEKQEKKSILFTVKLENQSETEKRIIILPITEGKAGFGNLVSSLNKKSNTSIENKLVNQQGADESYVLLGKDVYEDDEVHLRYDEKVITQLKAVYLNEDLSSSEEINSSNGFLKIKTKKNDSKPIGRLLKFTSNHIEKIFNFDYLTRRTLYVFKTDKPILEILFLSNEERFYIQFSNQILKYKDVRLAVQNNVKLNESYSNQVTSEKKDEEYIPKKDTDSFINVKEYKEINENYINILVDVSIDKYSEETSRLKLLFEEFYLPVNRIRRFSYKSYYSPSFRFNITDETIKNAYLFVSTQDKEFNFKITDKVSLNSNALNVKNSSLTEINLSTITDRKKLFELVFEIDQKDKANLPNEYYIDIMLITNIDSLSENIKNSLEKLNDITTKQLSFSFDDTNNQTEIGYFFIRKSNVLVNDTNDFIFEMLSEGENDNFIFDKVGFVGSNGAITYSETSKGYFQKTLVKNDDITYNNKLFVVVIQNNNRKIKSEDSIKYLIKPSTISVDLLSSPIVLKQYTLNTSLKVNSFYVRLSIKDDQTKKGFIYYQDQEVKSSKIALSQYGNDDAEGEFLEIDEKIKRKGFYITNQKYLYIKINEVPVKESLSLTNIFISASDEYKPTSKSGIILLKEGEERKIEYFINLTKEDSNSIIYLIEEANEESDKKILNKIVSDHKEFNDKSGFKSIIGEVTSSIVFITLELKNTNKDSKGMYFIMKKGDIKMNTNKIYNRQLSNYQFSSSENVLFINIEKDKSKLEVLSKISFSLIFLNPETGLKTGEETKDKLYTKEFDLQKEKKELIIIIKYNVDGKESQNEEFKYLLKENYQEKAIDSKDDKLVFYNLDENSILNFKFSYNPNDYDIFFDKKDLIGDGKVKFFYKFDSNEEVVFPVEKKDENVLDSKIKLINSTRKIIYISAYLESFYKEDFYIKTSIFTYNNQIFNLQTNSNSDYKKKYAFILNSNFGYLLLSSSKTIDYVNDKIKITLKSINNEFNPTENSSVILKEYSVGSRIDFEIEIINSSTKLIDINLHLASENSTKLIPSQTQNSLQVKLISGVGYILLSNDIINNNKDVRLTLRTSKNIKIEGISLKSEIGKEVIIKESSLVVDFTKEEIKNFRLLRISSIPITQLSLFYKGMNRRLQADEVIEFTYTALSYTEKDNIFDTDFYEFSELSSKSIVNIIYKNEKLKYKSIKVSISEESLLDSLLVKDIESNDIDKSYDNTEYTKAKTIRLSLKENSLVKIRIPIEKYYENKIKVSITPINSDEISIIIVIIIVIGSILLLIGIGFLIRYFFCKKNDDPEKELLDDENIN